MSIDVAVHFSKLRTVAFINNENAFLLFERVHNSVILLGTKRRRHLLNRRDNKCFIGIGQVIYKRCRAVCVAHTALFKTVVFVNSWCPSPYGR